MKDEKTPALQGGWHMQNPQTWGWPACTRLALTSRVSQPDLPACLATRVACTFQHGTCHILHSSPSLLPMALSAHVLPSPGKPSDSLPRPHLLNMPSHQSRFLCVPTALITRHHERQFPSISCVIPEGRDCVLVLLIALAQGTDMKRMLNKYLSDK